MTNVVQAAGGPPETSADLRYRCGTLTYTKASLFVLFSWLLWGDFCFTLMEAIPNILPLLMKAEGAPNTLVSLLMTTIPSVMNFALNPVLSTLSDRFRGKRGRRIPFLLAATPFVGLFLVLLGFSRPLGAMLHAALVPMWPGLEGPAVALALICALIVGFRFFELCVNTVFWYLFNDVVPAAFMGRFLGLFRVVGSLAGALFNFFLLKHAETHTAWIFGGVGLLYTVAFLLMGLKVKEGDYPEPAPLAEGRPTMMGYLKGFFRECFSHRLYRLVFLYTTVIGAFTAIGVFSLFLALSVGLTLGDVGKISGIAMLVGTVLMYPVGSLIDRLHPLRIMIAAQLGYCLGPLVQLTFLFMDFPAGVAFWVYAAAVAVILPFNVANTAAALPMVMRLFPHDRFGQFCAANAMCGSVGSIVGGVLAGVFLDVLKSFFPANDFYYRFIPVWSIGFMLVAAGATYLIYREWKALGGDAGYKPPGEGDGIPVSAAPGPA